jgi:transposase
MEKLLLSAKERRRLSALAAVKTGTLTLTKAAELMGLSYRQAKRVWARYQKEGDAGLVHRARGGASARRKPESLRQKVLARYRARYAGFGPTLATEHLAREGLEVDHETLRRWLLAEGLHAVRRRRQQHRAWRARKEHRGELVQMDGSEHDWFEGRRARAVLLVMIDDADNWTHARFFEAETTRASYDSFEGYVQKRRLPVALYVDRDSIYRTDAEPSVEQQLRGEEPLTQFGRAMKTLGVKIICAHSPQAKGRVERRHAVLQDRLVKEMRLENIGDLESANAFLEKDFLRRLNRQFTVQPRQELDLHRPAPREMYEVLSWQAERQVQRDWTVVWEGRWLQIDRAHEGLCLAGKKVIVRERRDGRLQVLWRGEKLQVRALSARPARAPQLKRVAKERVVKAPAAGHPWRQFGAAVGREYWKGAKAAGRAARGTLAAADSARPSLRSGLTASAAANARNNPKGTVLKS